MKTMIQSQGGVKADEIKQVMDAKNREIQMLEVAKKEKELMT